MAPFDVQSLPATTGLDHEIRSLTPTKRPREYSFEAKKGKSTSSIWDWVFTKQNVPLHGSKTDEMVLVVEGNPGYLTINEILGFCEKFKRQSIHIRPKPVEEVIKAPGFHAIKWSDVPDLIGSKKCVLRLGSQSLSRRARRQVTVSYKRSPQPSDQTLRQTCPGMKPVVQTSVTWAAFARSQDDDMSLHLAGLSSFCKIRVFVNMFKVNWVDKVFEHNLEIHRIPWTLVMGWMHCGLRNGGILTGPPRPSEVLPGLHASRVTH